MPNLFPRRIASLLFAHQAMLIALTVVLTGCTSKQTPPIVSNSNQEKEAQIDVQQVKETATGLALFISEEFQGSPTASGETLDQGQMVAAHPSYPMGTIVRVINLENERTVEVRIIDRSATGKNREDDIIDLSRAAAEQLGFVKKGKVRVHTDVLEWGDKQRG